MNGEVTWNPEGYHDLVDTAREVGGPPLLVMVECSW